MRCFLSEVIVVFFLSETIVVFFFPRFFRSIRVSTRKIGNRRGRRRGSNVKRGPHRGEGQLEPAKTGAKTGAKTRRYPNRHRTGPVLKSREQVLDGKHHGKSYRNLNDRRPTDEKRSQSRSNVINNLL